ncbi:MAG: hypothetical protein WBZ36_14280 [Candidatus Nitrosopolaris sp.]
MKLKRPEGETGCKWKSFWAADKGGWTGVFYPDKDTNFSLKVSASFLLK